MPIKFFCSTCGVPVRTDDDKAGRILVCPKCKNKVQVPNIIEKAKLIDEPAIIERLPEPKPDTFQFDSEPEEEQAYYPPIRGRRKNSGAPTGLVAFLIVFGLAAFIAIIFLATNSSTNAAKVVSGGASLVCLLVFGLPLYFLPSIIAFCRGHHQRFAILMLNFFTAWTFIAWAACIVWSFTAIDSREHIHHHYNH